MTEGKIIHAKPATPALPESGGTDSLLRLAVEHNLDVEKLERLVALKHAEESRLAERAFFAALAAFQRECPIIPKRKRVTTSGGMSYAYAEFDEIVKALGQTMASHGLSFSFDSEQKDGSFTSVCILRHEEGHSIRSTFTIPTATRAGMSDQQKIGSARTYANRNALLNVLGIATGEPDTDGADPTTITEHQALDLETLIQETKTDRAKFLAYFRVGSLEEVRASDFGKAVAMLEKKREVKP